MQSRSDSQEVAGFRRSVRKTLAFLALAIISVSSS